MAKWVTNILNVLTQQRLTSQILLTINLYRCHYNKPIPFSKEMGLAMCQHSSYSLWSQRWVIELAVQFYLQTSNKLVSSNGTNIDGVHMSNALIILLTLFWLLGDSYRIKEIYMIQVSRESRCKFNRLWLLPLYMPLVYVSYVSKHSIYAISIEQSVTQQFLYKKKQSEMFLAEL